MKKVFLFSILCLSLLCTAITYGLDGQNIYQSDPSFGHRFGGSVDVDGDRCIVGATGAASAYIFEFSGEEWVETAILGPDDADGDGFACSVALDGDYAVVGAKDDGDQYFGAVYIFFYDGTNWSQQQKLTVDDSELSDYLGHSVAIDGDVVVAGAFKDDIGDLDDAGSAYVFERDGATWTQTQKLTASDACEDGEYGYSVAVSGTTIVVGADQDGGNGQNSGAAYVYVHDGTTWVEEEKLVSNEPGVSDYFGISVSIDGDAAIVGSFSDDDLGYGAGAAYIYNRTDTVWSLSQKIFGSDSNADDYFGWAVSINGDVAIVGAKYGPGSIENDGAAYLFMYDGTEWNEQFKINAESGGARDEFGYAVAVNGDHALVGRWGDSTNGSRSGSAYIYWNLDDPSSVDDSKINNIPESYTLSSAYPNPFNPSTSLTFNMVRTNTVQIKVLNTMGQEVSRLVDGTRTAGKHTITWNSANVSSGIYIVLMQVEGQSITRKITLIK